MAAVEARLLVGGDWEGTPTLARPNPARPTEIACIAAVADAAIVHRALAAAVVAQQDWQRRSLPERGAILMAAGDRLEHAADSIAADLTREEGKTLREALGEVRRASAILRFFGSEGWRIGGQTFSTSRVDDLVYTRREPLGVVAAITPWNFPIAIPAWKIAPALISGNAVVLKPATATPATAAHLVRSLVDAGMPPGVVTLLLGSGREIGDQLVGDARVAGISFTGSVEVGRRIHALAAPRRARVQLEMGGKNALVVLDDADPAEAARIAAAGGFGLTGQACTATSRVICQARIAGRFVDALVAESRRYQPGDGLDDAVLMGPVVSDTQLAIDRSYIEGAASDSRVRVLSGSDAPVGLLQAPAIIVGVESASPLAQEEIFGPIVSVIEVADLTEAIQVVNHSRYGLSAGIVTADLGAVQRFVRDARVGVVKVNQPTSGVELNVPFGGVGDSSTNTYREQGDAAIEFYTWIKSVYVSPPAWS